MSTKKLKKEQFTLLRILQFVYERFTEFEAHVALTSHDIQRGRKALKELEDVALKSIGKRHGD